MITEEQIAKLKRLIDDRRTLEDKLKKVNNFIPEDGIKVEFNYRTYNNYQDLAEIYCNYDEIIEILKEKFFSEIEKINEKINSLTIVEVNNNLEI